MVSILLDSNVFDLLFDKDMGQIRIDIKKNYHRNNINYL